MPSPRFHVSDRLRVAQVGCGAWGSNVLRELASHPDVEVAVVIDPDPRARSLSQRLLPNVRTASSIDAIAMEPVDAVMIASPGPLHAEHARVALANDAHVFVEKPMTTRVADARQLVSCCHARKRIGMVGHLLHHHDAVRTMLALIRQGTIGTPILFRSARLCQRGSRDADGSLLWSLAPHDMSVLRAIDPNPVRWMNVELRTLGPAPAPNVADLRLRMTSGLEAHVVVSRAHRRKVRRMEVIGSDATIVFDDLEPRTKLLMRWRGRAERVPHGDTPPLRAEVQAFVRCAKSGSPPEIGFAEGLSVVEMLERAHALTSGGHRPELSAAR